MINRTDMNAAMQQLSTTARIPSLQKAVVVKNAMGLPIAYSGGFATVYQIKTEDRDWALRIWIDQQSYWKERYQVIADYLNSCHLPYFIDLLYEEKSIKVGSAEVDTVRMPWVEGKSLKQYIEDNIGQPARLAALTDRFLQMVFALRTYHISHGDLQANNILVNAAGEIILIDYDSLCVPSLIGKEEFVSGTSGYQHGSRINGRDNCLSLNADYFSEIVIYLSLLAFARSPQLFHEYKVQGRDKELLFSQADFDTPLESSLLKELQALDDYNINQLVIVLLRYLHSMDYLLLTDWLSYPLLVSLNKVVTPFISQPTTLNDFIDPLAGEFVLVHGGSFMMGATPEQGDDVEDDEKPVHNVSLSDYYMGRYQVTQKQWHVVMGNNPSSFKGDNHPVECVSWEDVQQYISLLNQKTGKKF